jgi:hypothetical protein
VAHKGPTTVDSSRRRSMRWSRISLHRNRIRSGASPSIFRPAVHAFPRADRRDIEPAFAIILHSIPRKSIEVIYGKHESFRAV